jgi:hypothetical protein
MWASGIGAVLTVAVVIGYRYDITLWDWLKLLVVPAVIAGGGIWFNRQQRDRELEIAERRTQDEALQAYLDQMSDMLLPKTDQPSLYKARPGDSLSSVARARTLTVLPRLDGDRKARVVQFLYESVLITRDHPVLALRGANLSRANLYRANLSGANLYRANLYRANLYGTDLHRADLSEANLRRATLFAANMSGADLRGASLDGANLDEADLSRADLSGAQGITGEELEQQASSLEGATMPNGQKYEVWLKAREKRQQEE